MLLLTLLQVAQYWNNKELLTYAAVDGARYFAAMRGYASPRTKTDTRVRSRLNGVLAPAATLNTALTMTTEVALPCSGACSCTSPAFARNGFCVTTCTTDSGCQAALGTADESPTASTVATVTLTYSFVPLFRYYAPLSSITSMSGTSTEVVQ